MKKLIAPVLMVIGLAACSGASTEVSTYRKGDQCYTEVHANVSGGHDKDYKAIVPCEFTEDTVTQLFAGGDD